MSRRFALGTEYEAFIDREVESGRYPDADEVVRDGLRLLGTLPDPAEIDAGTLRRLVEEARHDPVLLDASDLFERLEAKYKQAAKAPGT